MPKCCYSSKIVRTKYELTDIVGIRSGWVRNCRPQRVAHFYPVQTGAFSFSISFMMEFANSKESTDQTAGALGNGPTQELDALPRMEKLQLSDTGIESSQTQISVESSSQYDPSKIMAGSTFPRASARKDHKPPSHTFSDCDTSSFQLRVGPNYAKTGAKAPAGPSLYEVAGME